MRAQLLGRGPPIRPRSPERRKNEGSSTGARLLGSGPPIRPRSPERKYEGNPMRAQLPCRGPPKQGNMQREPSFLGAAHPSDPGAQKGNMKGAQQPRPHPTQDPERRKHEGFLAADHCHVLPVTKDDQILQASCSQNLGCLMLFAFLMLSMGLLLMILLMLLCLWSWLWL